MSSIFDPERVRRDRRLFRRRWAMRAFLLKSMPLGLAAGLRVDAIDDSVCVVSLPGGWRTQNPFRSMYWAAQGMAAELATGAPMFVYTRAAPAPVRTLVGSVEARFVKPAHGRISFTCADVAAAADGVARACGSDESVDCPLVATGRDARGEVVSEWTFRWSFRAKR